MHDSRRTRLVLSVLLIIAVALITLDFRDGGSSPLHRVGADVFGPVENVAGDVTSPVANVFDSVTGGDGAKISALEQQNDTLRAELSAAQLSQSAQTQLQQLLQLAGRGGYRIVAATVIAAGGDYSDTVTINAGTADGIKTNETVLNGQGLVGTVTSASSSTATVLLADDASSVVGVRMADTSQIGAVTGTGKSMIDTGQLQLRLFDASAQLHPGERMVTFGSVGGEPYVPGVPVGTVTQVEPSSDALTQAALVRPFVNFTALGVVGVVITPPKVNPRDSVLPPSPPPPAPVATTKPKNNKPRRVRSVIAGG